MDFDTFVSQPERIQTRITHQLQEAERLQSICNSASAVYSDIKVQTSRENKREIWLTKYIDSKQKVSDLMEEYDRVTEEVRDWLYKNLTFETASLLEYRYCDGLRNNEIAELVCQAEQTIKNKISKAVQQAKIIYQQKGDNENGTLENSL